MHPWKLDVTPKCQPSSVDNHSMELMTPPESGQACVLCGSPARFLAPVGLVCPADALFVAAGGKDIAEERLLYLSAGRHRISGANNRTLPSLVS